MLNHRIVEIEPTTNCTRNCTFCRPSLLKEDRERPPYLSLENHSSFIRQLREHKYAEWVVYCGHGEPLMHPAIESFIAEAKEQLPQAKVALATNGDLITKRFLDSTPLDSICWDCYADDATSKFVPMAVKESSFAPERFAVIDCTKRGADYWLSRAGTIFDSPLAMQRQKLPCGSPKVKLFYSARGKFCLCCNDGARRMTKLCTLNEWLADAKYVQAQIDLAAGRRSSYRQCMACEYFGEPSVWPANGLSGLYPTIDKTRFWT